MKVKTKRYLRTFINTYPDNGVYIIDNKRVEQILGPNPWKSIRCDWLTLRKPWACDQYNYDTGMSKKRSYRVLEGGIVEVVLETPEQITI